MILLLGGVGSGKSTAAEYLNNHYGIYIIEADKTVHKLYEPGEAGSAYIRELLGGEYLDGRGAVDRKKLSEILFADSDIREKVDLRLHALAKEAVLKEAAQAEAGGYRIVCVEAALCPDDWKVLFDYIIYVYADLETRIARLYEYRGMDRDRALRVIDAQPAEAWYRNIADAVIDNSMGIKELEKQTDEVIKHCERKLGQFDISGE